MNADSVPCPKCGQPVRICYGRMSQKWFGLHAALGNCEYRGRARWGWNDTRAEVVALVREDRIDHYTETPEARIERKVRARLEREQKLNPTATA